MTRYWRSIPQEKEKTSGKVNDGCQPYNCLGAEVSWLGGGGWVVEEERVGSEGQACLDSGSWSDTVILLQNILRVAKYVQNPPYRCIGSGNISAQYSEKKGG
jgi:hypothetical protein